MSSTMFRCDHCNTSMTGQENYQQHIEGKKHLKKLKAAGINSTTPVAPNTAARQKSQEVVQAKLYAGQFVKPSSEASNQGDSDHGNNNHRDSNQAHSNQAHSNQGNNNHRDSNQAHSNQAHSNQGSSNHGNGNQGNGDVAPPPSGYIKAAQSLGTNSTDPVMNAVKANLLGKLPLKRVAYNRKCEVCDVEYSSSSHEEQHLSGKKHKRKVEMKEATEGANAVSMYCGFCNLHANSVEQMNQHRAGTAHNKKVENARKAQQGKQPPHSVAKKKFVPSSAMETSDQLLMPPPPPQQLLDLKPLTYDK